MKKKGSILYETRLIWEGDDVALAIAGETGEQVNIIANGNYALRQPGYWSTEQLILSAASSYFVNSYLLAATQNNLDISGIQCDAIGDVVLVNKIPTLAFINLYPKIFVAKDILRKKAEILIDQAIKNCPSLNMLHTNIYYHPSVEVKPVKKNNIYSNKKREIFF